MSRNTSSLATPNASGLWRRFSRGTVTLHHVVSVFDALYVQGVDTRLFDDAVPDNGFGPLPPPAEGVWWALARGYEETSEPSSVPFNARLYAVVTDTDNVHVVRAWQRDGAHLADIGNPPALRGRMVASGRSALATVTHACAKVGLGVVFVGALPDRLQWPEHAR